MKKIQHLAGLALMLLISAHGANAQSVGIGTPTPDASAILDLTSVNKGLLIPRVSLTGLNDATTIASPATGLLVYNTNGAVPGGVGFYYNSGKGSAIWVKLVSGSGSGWGLTGNAATDSTANFIGTTDLKPLVFRVNNGFAGQLSSIGGISLGRAANATTRIANPNVIAIGDSALFSNQDNNEIAIGNSALFSNTTGQLNVGVGNFSLASNTIGSANVAMGVLSLSVNDTANLNTGIGFRALQYTSADNNTGIGAYALQNNFAGKYNTAAGMAALISNDNGWGNTGIGEESLFANTTGDWNTAQGIQALSNNTTGTENTAIGSFSMFSSTTGISNTALGADALGSLTTGSFNTAIGDSADVPAIGGAFFNTTAIGYKAVATGNNSISIGNTAVTSIKGQVPFSTFSDGRYKKDVVENIRGLDFIMLLRPVSYHYDFNKIRLERYSNNLLLSSESSKGFANKNIHQTSEKLNSLVTLDKNFTLNGGKRIAKTAAKTISNPALAKYYEEVSKNDQIRYTGFIAQEVEAAANKIGFDFSGVDKPKNESDQYALRYSDFVVPLVKAVQEQQAIIDSQNKKIDALIRRIETLEAAKQ